MAGPFFFAFLLQNMSAEGSTPEIAHGVDLPKPLKLGHVDARISAKKTITRRFAADGATPSQVARQSVRDLRG